MKIALVGIGKIAKDQHAPALDQLDDWELTATVSRNGFIDGIKAYKAMDELLEAEPDIKVVSLSLPPGPRFEYAVKCLKAGRHVMLEKPPGATLAEVRRLEALAEKHGVVLFASWHSRMAKGVQVAKAALANKDITSARIVWKESVREWHPGQEWVFEPGGMGVLDPGINALSIMTEVMPREVHLKEATLLVPEGRQTPIAISLEMTGDVTGAFDWRDDGTNWCQTYHCSDGTVVELPEGGNRCVIDGEEQEVAELGEYPALYAHFAELVRDGRSDVDLRPFVHVSDIMQLGRREVTDPFEF